MKEGWRTVIIGDVCDLMTGGTPSRSKSQYYDGGDIPWLVSGDVHRRQIQACEGRITQLGLKSSNARWLPYNSVIIALNGQGKTRGTVALLRMEATCNQSLVSIHPKDVGELIPEFLFWNLHGRYEEIRRITGDDGNERRGLNMSLIRNICFPLPPLEEQRKIVAVLDEAFADITTSIANAEQNLANAREFFVSYLEKRFAEAQPESKIVPLERLCVVDRVITYGVIKLGEHTPDGVPCLRTSNVRWLDMDLRGMKCIEPGLSKEYSRTVLRGGEVLVNVRGTLGGVAVADQSMTGWNVSREVAVVPCDVSRIDPQYLAYWIGTRASQDWLADVEKGVAYTGINIGDLRSLPVAHLAMEEQRSIVVELDASMAFARELEASARRKIAVLASLKQSLLARAFAGELSGHRAIVSERSNDNFAGPEFAAQIVAFAYERHVAMGRVRNFGTVKAEKTLHLAEALGGIDLGRQPMRQAAGPDDAVHRHATWDWARSHQFFRFVRRNGGGHDFAKLSDYDAMIEQARTAVRRAGPSVANAIELLVDMDKEFAELVATTYGAWNNLILDGCAFTDDAIVHAARDGWHPDKLSFDRSRFHDAIRFIRRNAIVPDGSAKRVGGQENLSL